MHPTISGPLECTPCSLLKEYLGAVQVFLLGLHSPFTIYKHVNILQRFDKENKTNVTNKRDKISLYHIKCWISSRHVILHGSTSYVHT